MGTCVCCTRKSGLAGNWDVKRHRWNPKSNEAGLGNRPVYPDATRPVKANLKLAFPWQTLLTRSCWRAPPPISICALTERARNSPECWSLSCSQMLDAAADLIQRDIRDTSCPFGSPPRWHISGSTCTPAVFSPALFILRGLWLMPPVLRAHRSSAACLTLQLFVFLSCVWRRHFAKHMNPLRLLGEGGGDSQHRWVLFCCMLKQDWN